MKKQWSSVYYSRSFTSLQPCRTDVLLSGFYSSVAADRLLLVINHVEWNGRCDGIRQQRQWQRRSYTVYNGGREKEIASCCMGTSCSFSSSSEMCFLHHPQVHKEIPLKYLHDDRRWNYSHLWQPETWIIMHFAIYFPKFGDIMFRKRADTDLLPQQTSSTESCSSGQHTNHYDLTAGVKKIFRQKNNLLPSIHTTPS